MWASDNNTDHSITVVDDWIFDSNLPTAIAFTQENMDLCCSTLDSKCTFDSIFRAIEFKEPEAKKKKRLSAQGERNVQEPFWFRNFNKRAKRFKLGKED